MNTEGEEGNGKSHRIWDWILAIVGVPFTAFGILFLFVGIVGGEMHEIGYTSFVLSPLSLAIGVPFLILRDRVTDSECNWENRRIWGWILVILGGWLILLLTGNRVVFLIFEQQEEISISEALFMVFGILLFINGIWLLAHNRKMPPSTPGSSDDLQRGEGEE